MHAALLNIINARWSDAAHTKIDCEIETSQFPNEYLPFTASSYDVENHGRAIYEALKCGKYGVIAEFCST